MSMFVCLSARISKKNMSKLHEIFCTCYLWPWLSRLLTTVHLLCTSEFVECLPIMGYMVRGHTHTHTTVLWPFFRDHLGEPVPEENFWTLWCKGRLTEADTLTIWLGATPSGLSAYQCQCLPPLSPHIFYRPDALPATQPTVSKHRRQYMVRG